jgi:hypothetical protein
MRVSVAAGQTIHRDTIAPSDALDDALLEADERTR